MKELTLASVKAETAQLDSIGVVALLDGPRETDSGIGALEDLECLSDLADTGNTETL